MKETYFESIHGLGNLYLEKTFLKFEEENILFICSDDAGNRYLSVCYEMRYALKWVLCQISKEMILQMLMKLITVRECFEHTKSKLLLITYTEEVGEISEWKSISQIDSNILPDTDFVLKYDIDKDVYHINICNEIFKEKEIIERHLKVDAVASEYLNKCNERIPADRFVVNNKAWTYDSRNRNWQEKWAC